MIVGGGYHGKSTLLRAIERGVYPHIAGDGREWVITRPDAVTVRAEDGRAVTGVDISPFIAGLPSGADTRSFSTTNASGSTSQAANLVEAVGAGASTLLIDEDTSATNFMIRDERMRALIPADQEPITPFIDRVRPLFTEVTFLYRSPLPLSPPEVFLIRQYVVAWTPSNICFPGCFTLVYFPPVFSAVSGPHLFISRSSFGLTSISIPPSVSTASETASQLNIINSFIFRSKLLLSAAQVSAPPP